MNNEPKNAAGHGWLIVILICAGIIVWGAANFLLVRDRPRAWDFGALPDVPGQSIYSVETRPPASDSARQLPRLPEAEHRPAAGAVTTNSAPPSGERAGRP